VFRASLGKHERNLNQNYKLEDEAYTYGIHLAALSKEEIFTFY
jgi:hypothetical protein